MNSYLNQGRSSPRTNDDPIKISNNLSQMSPKSQQVDQFVNHPQLNPLQMVYGTALKRQKQVEHPFKDLDPHKHKTLDDYTIKLPGVTYPEGLSGNQVSSSIQGNQPPMEIDQFLKDVNQIRGMDPSKKQNERTEASKKTRKVEPIQSYYRLKATVKQALDLAIEPRLKCLSGEHAGEMVPLSFSEKGDIVGNGALNRDTLTVHIDDPKMNAMHFRIAYKEKCLYTVMDLGTTSGTWIGLNPGEPTEVVLDRTYKLGPYEFKFFRGPLINDVEELLELFGMVHCTDDLYSNGVRSLKHLFSLTQTMWDAIGLTESDKKELQQKCQTFSNQTNIEEMQGYRIIMSVTSETKKQQHLIEFGLKGIKIGYHLLCDYRLDRWDMGRSEVEFEVNYTEGKYYLFVYPSLGNKHFQRKLEPDEKYTLRPDQLLLFGSHQFKYDIYEIGAVSEIGNRTINEDRILIKQDFPFCKRLKCSYYCVIDGHGGDDCATFLEKNIPIAFARNFDSQLDQSDNIFETFNEIIRKVFFELDAEFHQKHNKVSYTCGATLNLVVLLGEIILCCNVGDCRAIVGKRNKQVLSLSDDHIPVRRVELQLDNKRPDEKMRIEKMGGHVDMDRLQGRMTISRCFGHFEYKKNSQSEGLVNKFSHRNHNDLLTCLPEIKVYFVEPDEDQFIMLFTDGILEHFTTEALANYVKEGLDSPINNEVGTVLRNLIKEDKQKSIWNDNISGILIKVPPF